MQFSVEYVRVLQCDYRCRLSLCFKIVRLVFKANLAFSERQTVGNPVAILGNGGTPNSKTLNSFTEDLRIQLGTQRGIEFVESA
jgi:hypothetical protein